MLKIVNNFKYYSKVHNQLKESLHTFKCYDNLKWHCQKMANHHVIIKYKVSHFVLDTLYNVIQKLRQYVNTRIRCPNYKALTKFIS